MRLLFALALATLACHDATAPTAEPVRLVLFGDSNTELGYSDALGRFVAYSYITADPANRPSPTAPNDPTQLAGKVEQAWTGAGPLFVVNHALAGTNTSAGIETDGSPDARASVNGVTRFEAEVLGQGYPWTVNGITRTRAFTPTALDFAYVSLGTNDCRHNVSYDSTLADLRWMVERWTAAGLPPSHLLLATIPPTVDITTCNTPGMNGRIRTLAQTTGVTLIDLSAFTSADDGLTWRGAAYSINPPRDVHYREWVRAWLGQQIVAAMGR